MGNAVVAPIARPAPMSRSAAMSDPSDIGVETRVASPEGTQPGIRNVRIFVSSPGDTIHERGRVDRVVERLNGEFAGTARLETIRWETEFYRAHATFQAEIPEAAECDIVIAIFRHRLGTELPASFAPMPDGTPYPSGTAYEVLSAIEHCRRFNSPDVYVFRQPEPPMVQLDDPEAERTQRQWERLKAFWETWFVGADGRYKAAFQNFASVDDFEAQLDRLLRGWLEEKFLHDRAAEWPIEVKGSPFRGLAAFGAKHEKVFFGRSRDIARAVDAWKDAAARGSPFLLVVGASGAGKSSLARAGLVPRITASGVIPTVDLWRVVIMHPSEASDGPITSLATRLFDGEEDIPEEERGRPPALPEIGESDYRTPAELAGLFAEAGSAASVPVVRALERAAEAERARQGSARRLHAGLLILVDQLDELFAPDIAPEQRAVFVRLLAGLAESGQVWLLATLRADLYQRFLGEPGLLALKTRGAAQDLSPPGPAELAEIVRKPAEAAGLLFETDPATGERLDERLLREADRPDMLPLLQLALDRLFEARVARAERSMLTVDAYQSLGGLAGIIDREAERAIAGLDQAEIGRLPRLLRRLAAIGEFDGAEASAAPASLTIRTAPLAELMRDAPSRRLVHALVEARILLTTGEGVGAGIRLAHQRVLSDWARARQLVDTCIRFFGIHKDVEAQRRLWQDAGRSRDLLIQPGRLLNRAESIVKDFGEELSPETLEFVRASGRRARMRQRLTAMAAVVFAVFALIASGAGYLAHREERRAEGSLEAAKNAVNVIVVDIAQGLRYVAGVPTATIQTILERVQDTVESLTRFAPDNLALSRVYLESLLEIATTYQTAGDLQRARDSAMKALERARELAEHYRDDPEWQRELTVTLNRLGSIARSGGEAAEALKEYNEAVGIMRPIADRDPNNQTWRRELAISLDGIGDVKSQTGDGRSALAAYDEGLAIVRDLAQQHPDDPELQRQIAVRLIETGDMRLTSGDAAAAVADYQQGQTIARKLVEKDPRNTQWQRDVFYSLIKIGDLKAQIGDDTAATGPYGEALSIVRRLAELDPGNPSLRLDVAQGLCKLGDVDLKKRDRDYAEGLTIMRGLVQRYPDNSRWQRELSVSLNKVGDVKLKDDDTDGAIAAYSEALTIVGHIAERDPANLLWLRDVGLSLAKVGDVRLRQGDAAGAAANYEQTLAKLRGLSEHDPNNMVWLEDLSITLNKLGDAKLRTGDPAAAATSYDESLAVAHRFADGDPDNAQWQSDLWVALNNVGDAKLRSGDASGGIANYQQALATARRLSEGNPKNTFWLRNLTVTLNKLGGAQSHTGDKSGAAASYNESLDVAHRLADTDPGNVQWQSDLWYALYNLGEAKLSLGDRAAARSLYADGLVVIRRVTTEDPDNVDRRTSLVVNLYRVASLEEDGPDREQALDEALAIVEQLRAANQLPPDKIGWPDRIRQMKH
jgi:tetratricopeptide (TPR) repeat protein